jgi:predicted ATPase
VPPRFSATTRVTPGSPFLTRIGLHDDRVVRGTHPFDIPILRDGLELTLSSPVTFFVGENGSGKSTLLEALAWSVGFGAQGGSRDHHFEEGAEGHALGRALKLGWRQRSTTGFFLRAETFYNFSTYLESVGSSFDRYGGESFHARSHGEAFLALFEHRFEDGLYILDEPEAALSPNRQLAFLSRLHELIGQKSQFIIATHSPIILAYPDATIFEFSERGVAQAAYEDLEHVQVTRSFLNRTDVFLETLLSDDD